MRKLLSLVVLLFMFSPIVEASIPHHHRSKSNPKGNFRVSKTAGKAFYKTAKFIARHA